MITITIQTLRERFFAGILVGIGEGVVDSGV
jgi:hypothetical protein